MRIVRAEAIPIALPFRERYRTAAGELDRREMVLLRLHTDGGHVGFGEAVPLSLRGGASLDRVRADLATCEPVIAGASAAPPLSRVPVEIRAWIHGLLWQCSARGAGTQALAALDIGLHDLAGRISGLPLWRLLGAGDIVPVHCNATIDAGEPSAVAARAAAQLAHGFRTFKVKVGLGAEADARRIAAVRRTIGPHSLLRIDANGAWSGAEAVERLGDLGRHDLELVEQPCREATGLATVRARIAIPVVADESVTSAADAEGIAAIGACDAATIKLAKVGGLLEALRIATIVPSYLSSALDGPVGIAAALHLAQVLPRAGYACRFDHGLATLNMFSAAYAPGDGLDGASLLPPSTPGLGVEVDEGRLAELRIA